MRLVDGETDKDGRVEVCLDGNWVRVCQGNGTFEKLLWFAGSWDFLLKVSSRCVLH